jgi:hypothetical protein
MLRTGSLLRCTAGDARVYTGARASTLHPGQAGAAALDPACSSPFLSSTPTCSFPSRRHALLLPLPFSQVPKNLIPRCSAKHFFSIHLIIYSPIQSFYVLLCFVFLARLTARCSSTILSYEISYLFYRMGLRPTVIKLCTQGSWTGCWYPCL